MIEPALQTVRLVSVPYSRRPVLWWLEGDFVAAQASHLYTAMLLSDHVNVHGLCDCMANCAALSRPLVRTWFFEITGHDAPWIGRDLDLLDVCDIRKQYVQKWSSCWDSETEAQVTEPSGSLSWISFLSRELSAFQATKHVHKSHFGMLTTADLLINDKFHASSVELAAAGARAVEAKQNYDFYLKQRGNYV